MKNSIYKIGDLVLVDKRQAMNILRYNNKNYYVQEYRYENAQNFVIGLVLSFYPSFRDSYHILLSEELVGHYFYSEDIRLFV